MPKFKVFEFKNVTPKEVTSVLVQEGFVYANLDQFREYVKTLPGLWPEKQLHIFGKPEVISGFPHATFTEPNQVGTEYLLPLTEAGLVYEELNVLAVQKAV